MIRRCEENDFEVIWQIINDGARAYKGVIPQDCRTEEKNRLLKTYWTVPDRQVATSVVLVDRKSRGITNSPI